MITVGVILWVLFLVWLVSSLYPSQEMRRDAAGHCAYYGIWVLLFGSALFIQYRIMAQSGHLVLAFVSDGIGVSLGVLRLWGIWRFGHDQQPPGGHKTPPQGPHTHQS